MCGFICSGWRRLVTVSGGTEVLYMVIIGQTTWDACRLIFAGQGRTRSVWRRARSGVSGHGDCKFCAPPHAGHGEGGGVRTGRSGERRCGHQGALPDREDQGRASEQIATEGEQITGQILGQKHPRMTLRFECWSNAGQTLVRPRQVLRFLVDRLVAAAANAQAGR